MPREAILGVPVQIILFATFHCQFAPNPESTGKFATLSEAEICHLEDALQVCVHCNACLNVHHQKRQLCPAVRDSTQPGWKSAIRGYK